MFEINIRSDLKQLERQLSDLAYKQLPFASAQAMTGLAKMAAKAEQENMGKVLDQPTPFTIKSVVVKPATKADQEAELYVKDIAAAYLDPYEFGGRNKGVGSRDAFFRPANIDLNQYGNLPKAKIAQLKARSDVFIGTVKAKNGEVINGIWQRVAKQAIVTRPAGKGTKKTVTRRGLNATNHLRLLVRFEDPHPVRQHLGWFDIARRVVNANLDRVMGQALAKAMASAR
jgi:hypothetical protein